MTLLPFRHEKTVKWGKGTVNLLAQDHTPRKAQTESQDASVATLIDAGVFPLNSYFFFFSTLIWVKKTGSSVSGQA